MNLLKALFKACITMAIFLAVIFMALYSKTTIVIAGMLGILAIITMMFYTSDT